VSDNLDQFHQSGDLPGKRRVRRDAQPLPIADAADDHVEELVPGYVLGALEPNEQQLVEFHIQFCPRCAGLVDRDLRTVGALALSVPAAVPPIDAKIALFSRVSQSDKARNSATATMTTQKPSATTEQTLPRSTPSAVSIGTAAAAAPVVAAQRSGWSRFGAFASVPLLAALMFTGVWGYNLNKELQTQDSAMSELQAQVSNFGAGGSTVQLSPGRGMPQAEGKLVLGADERAGMLQLDLNSDSAAGDYAIWVVQDGSLVPAGEVQVGADGTGAAQFTLAQPFSDYESIRILPVDSTGKNAVVLTSEYQGLGGTGSELDALP